MTKIKYFFIIGILLVAFSCKNSIKTTVKTKTSDTKNTTIDALRESLVSADFTKLKPFLSNDFVAGDFAGEIAHQVVPQILAQHPKLKSLKVIKIKDKEVLVDLNFEQMEKMSSKIIFDDKDKITKISFFDDLLGKSITETVELPEFEKVSSFKVPFELNGGLIIVKAKFNGKEEDFLLDSGSPVVVINTNKQNSTETVRGVGGTTSASNIENVSFDWNGIKVNNATFMGMDLSHLEKEIGKPFKGLIGHDVLKNYILKFDYKTKMLQLTSKIEDIKNIKQVISFTYQAHIPTFEININNKSYVMGLDTGAESNLLDLPQYKTLDKNNIKPLQGADLVGADGNEMEVEMFSIDKLNVDGISFNNMAFVSSDISHLNNGYGLNLAGLLGYPFLNKNIAVDFTNSKIYVLEK